MAGNYEAVRKEVSADFLRIFTNNCIMPRLLKRNYEKYFEENVKIGSSLDIKTALRVVGADGQAFQPEGLVRVTVPLSITFWNQESYIYNDTEAAMFLNDDKRANYVKPHAVNLANKVDRYMLQYMQSIIPNWTGTPGTTPTGSAGVVPTAYQSAQTKLDQLLADQTDRYVVYNATYNQQVIQAAQTIFNPGQVIGKMFLQGKVGRYADMDFFKDEQIPSMTIGTYAGSGQVNGANQVGSSILTNNWTAASVSLSQGPGVDRCTFAGCYEINYQSRLALPGILKQFSIITPVTDAAGAATFNVFPSVLPSGPYQNCSASPTNGGAVTIAGATGVGCTTAFAFQEGAFEWVSIPLQDVSEYGAKCEVITDAETGISLRCIEQWDSRLGEVTTRMDFVWGIAQMEADHKALVIFG